MRGERRSFVMEQPMQPVSKQRPLTSDEFEILGWCVTLGGDSRVKGETAIRRARSLAKRGMLVENGLRQRGRGVAFRITDAGRTAWRDEFAVRRLEMNERADGARKGVGWVHEAAMKGTG